MKDSDEVYMNTSSRLVYSFQRPSLEEIHQAFPHYMYHVSVYHLVPHSAKIHGLTNEQQDIAVDTFKTFGPIPRICINLVRDQVGLLDYEICCQAMVAGLTYHTLRHFVRHAAAKVVTPIGELPGAAYQVLVPKEKGLESILSLLATRPDKPPIDEVAIFYRCYRYVPNGQHERRGAPRALCPRCPGQRHQVRAMCRDYMPVQCQGRLKHMRDMTKELLDLGCYK